MVMLKCVAEGRRLRIKIVSAGYLNNANCQFPRDIREVGRFYECAENDVTLVQMRGKYYYTIRKSGIKIIQDHGSISIRETPVKPQKVYNDEDNVDCSICLVSKKEVIYVPCGHFISCDICNTSLKKRICPICRSPISTTISSEEMAL